MDSNVAQLPLSHKLWAWFETNRKPALLAVCAVVAVALVAWFLVWRQDEQKIEAGIALSNVAASQMHRPNPHTNSADAYLKVAASYPNSTAAGRALLLAGASLFTEGK